MLIGIDSQRRSPDRHKICSAERTFLGVADAADQITKVHNQKLLFSLEKLMEGTRNSNEEFLKAI